MNTYSLRELRFADQFIQMLKNIYRNRTIKPQINQKLGAGILLKKGLSQECYLASFFFQ